MRLKIPIITGFLLFTLTGALFAGGMVEQIISGMLGEQAAEAVEAEVQKVQPPTEKPAVGSVSISGNRELFESGRIPLMGGNRREPFFQEKGVPQATEPGTSRVSSVMLGRDDAAFAAGTAPGIVPPGSSGSTVSGTGTDDADKPKYYGLSIGGAAGILNLSEAEALQMINVMFSAAVDWAPISHLGLGFKFGIIPQADGSQAMIPEVSASYFFSATGLQGLYTGMTAGNIVGSLTFWLAPQIGYRLVLFDFLAIDGKFAYTVTLPVSAHGPMVTISTGYSF